MEKVTCNTIQFWLEVAGILRNQSSCEQAGPNDTVVETKQLTFEIVQFENQIVEVMRKHTRGRERGGEKRWPKKEVEEMERPVKELCRAAIVQNLLQNPFVEGRNNTELSIWIG